MHLHRKSAAFALIFRIQKLADKKSGQEPQDPGVIVHLDRDDGIHSLMVYLHNFQAAN